MKFNSLRSRLLAILLGITALVWCAVVVSSIVEAHHEVDELFDAQLARSARILIAQLGEEPDEMEIDYGEEFHKYERKIAFQVWDDRGRLALRSANAPDTPLNERGEGFADETIGGKTWRVFSRRDASRGLVVQVGERHEVRDELIEGVVERLLVPVALALPLLAAALWLGIGKGLRPLHRVADEVGQREPQRLDPLETGDVPSEIHPLVAALNRLLGRLDSALQNERRFTADAAHELRTPLAALKTQAQVAERASQDEERRNALHQVVEGVDRATHLVEQLLTLARLDPGGGLPAAAPVALRRVAVECAALQAAAALEKNIELAVEEGDGEVAGDAAMLAVLVRNLIDNAIRYTPSGGTVSVAVGNAFLEVCDSGPGIAPTERERVTQRFYRILGNNAEGSGLGLSIVARIVQLHGATLTLGEGQNGVGLRARVVFPQRKSTVPASSPASSR